VQDDAMLGGKPIRNIDYTTHIKGFMAELMSKGLAAGEADEPFSEDEAETLMGMIRSFGDLTMDNLYKGSFRAGYAEGGFLKHGVQKDIIAFRDLLKTNIGRRLVTANEGDTGPILMQPVGGMDMTIKALEKQLAGKIRYHAMVASVKVGDKGVDIAYDYEGSRHTM